MPWKQSLPMDQKTQFVSEYLRDTISHTELCDRYSISRKPGYIWIDRCLAEGPTKLKDRSRRPHLSPVQTAETLRLAIIEARRRHPSWGARKLLRHLIPQRGFVDSKRLMVAPSGLALWSVSLETPVECWLSRASQKDFGRSLVVVLSSKDSQADWASRGTICKILRRAALACQRTMRRKPGHPGKPISIATVPIDLWCVDFKRQFKTRDGRYCYHLTVTHRYSRYLLDCQALLSTEIEGAGATFRQLFKKYG